MSYLIPLDLGLFQNEECVFEAMFNVTVTDKDIKDINNFILDGHFTGELVDIPGKIYDKFMDEAYDVVDKIIKQEHIDETKGNIEFRTTWVLPIGILKLLPAETVAQIDLKPILEFYEIKKKEDLFTLEEYLPIEIVPKKPAQGMFMKTLAIRQPWASLIALGIKDVELRDAMPTKPRKIFVAASGTMVPWKELDGMVQTLILDLEKAGVMPAYKEWPTKCIIGHVDIVKASFDHVDSIWGRDWEGMKYTLRNAEVLDEPLYGLNKATQFFYNVDGYDEQHLPKSHKADLKGIKLPK